jgi:hypothetical protein
VFIAHDAILPSSPTIRAGRVSVCCADARSRRLWKERLDPRTARAYFDKDQPLTTQGKFALARALLLEGERADAQSLVREAWHYDNFSGDLEAQILDVFRDLITDADHKARMDIRLYVEDIDGAMRAANRAGGNAPVIAKARLAVIKRAADAKDLKGRFQGLAALVGEMRKREDPYGYLRSGHR